MHRNPADIEYGGGESRFVISSFIFQKEPYKFKDLEELKLYRLGQIPKVYYCVICVYVSAIITTVCIACLSHIKSITQTHRLPGSALKTSIITNENYLCAPWEELPAHSLPLFQ